MNDPHDLNRFLLAQQDDYERALAEVKNGRKRWLPAREATPLKSSAYRRSEAAIIRHALCQRVRAKLGVPPSAGEVLCRRF
jgi:uncharacterized protein (DUF1810 family)